MDPCTRDDLRRLEPRHDSFVGIDSDGCVFDTMEIKQKQCFHGLIVTVWHLEPIEKQVRECAEFANLYSRWRGQNRFIALIKTFDLLRVRPEVVRAGVAVPALDGLRRFIDSGAALGNPELARAVRETGDGDLAAALRWSTEVNQTIARTVKSIPPFAWARRSLERMARDSDAICVSQTPFEALLREWQEHDVLRFVRALAGQELGTKGEHLQLAAGGKYAPERILMVGDAPGDRTAAERNRACFFPINPAHEEASWELFHNEAYDRFLAGRYAGEYERRLIAEFEALLPEAPPWERRA
jgi:hypothetical protein